MQRFFCYLLIDIHIDVDGVDTIIEHILQNYHAGESTPVQFKKKKKKKPVLDCVQFKVYLINRQLSVY